MPSAPIKFARWSGDRRNNPEPQSVLSGINRTSIADEMREEHRRQVLEE
jgi:hypothetical protein